MSIFDIFSTKEESIDSQRRKFQTREMDLLIKQNKLNLTRQYEFKINSTKDWREKINLKHELEVEINNSCYGNSDWYENAFRLSKEKANDFALKLLQKKFHCCICNKPPQYCRNDYDYEYDNHSENWDQPGDLWECSICKKLFCTEHIYNSICQNCAQKL